VIQHLLKCWPSSFDLVRSGLKAFEVRVNDRDFSPGQRVVLAEWNPNSGRTTGRAVSLSIRNVVQGKWGLPANVCVFDWHPESLTHCGVVPDCTRVVQ
jgi:hypothetical protein